MPAIIIPARKSSQPSAPVSIERGHWLFDSGGEFFTHNRPVVNLITGAVATNIGGATLNKFVSRGGILCTDVDGSDQAIVSSSAVTPPADCTIFAVFSVPSFVSADRATIVGGFPTNGGGAAERTGGNAHMSLHGALDQFGAKIAGVDLTYDDGTTETVYLSGGTTDNRSVWFIAASYQNASSVHMYARDLFSGEEVSSVTAKTKTLKQVEQAFNIGSCAPNGTTSWAATGTRPFAYVGWVPKFVGREKLAEIGHNPWGLFRKNRIIYFPSAGGGGATIAGDSGTYTLTGSDVSLKAGRKLAADSGTYSLTGTAAALRVGRKLAADSGSYSLSGTDAAFKRGYALVASSGTYTVSGTAVSLKAGRKLAADSGSYTLTGTDATLTYAPAGSYNLTAESGSYSLTGTAATLKVSRKLSADSGAYSLTGTTATLAKGVRMAAASGSYTLTGSNVSFARTYVLTAESGSYTLTGTSAGLTWSGAPVVEVPTNGGPSIYGKPVFREKQFRKEYEEQVKRIEDEKRLARILREDEEITVIMALMAA